MYFFIYFQILIVVSELPLANKVHWEFHTTEFTQFVCPSNVWTHTQVLVFQILIVVSWDPLADQVPFEFHVTSTQNTCTLQ